VSHLLAASRLHLARATFRSRITGFERWQSRWSGRSNPHASEAPRLNLNSWPLRHSIGGPGSGWCARRARTVCRSRIVFEGQIGTRGAGTNAGHWRVDSQVERASHRRPGEHVLMRWYRRPPLSALHRGAVARQSGWEGSDNQDGHFGGRGDVIIVAAQR
jgi:hypothetical protein